MCGYWLIPRDDLENPGAMILRFVRFTYPDPPLPPPVSIASANVSISLTPHPPAVIKCQHLKDPPLPPNALTSYVHGP